MNVLKAAYEELVFGGHLLALGTASIAASAAFILGMTPAWNLLLMAYLFSFGAYSVNRLSDYEEDSVSNPGRTSYLASRRRLLPIVSGLSFGIGYALAILRNLAFFAGLLVPLLLAVAYSFGSKSMGRVLGMNRLKEGFLIKNIAISFGWSLIPVLVGLYYLQLPIALVAFCPFIFMRLMVNTVFFDIRDVEADIKYGVKTLPGSLGLGASWRFMDIVDALSCVYVVTLFLAGVFPLFVGLLVVFTPYSMIYRHYARKTSKHKDALRDFAADGEYIIWGLVTYLGRI